MDGKICVITGATSGIGLEAAVSLAQQGAELVLVGRDERRGQAALRRILRAAPGAQVTIRYADLLEMNEVRRLAMALRSTLPRLDLLINNAGAVFDRPALTADGLERTFALNHMAPFLLTNLLLPHLAAAPRARIVTVASRAHVGAKLDFEDLTGRSAGAGWRAYQRSKLANILFTRALARRLEGSSITANCLHPGFVATRFGEPGNAFVTRSLIGMAKRFAAISPEKGAQTLIYLASAAEVEGVSGRYFVRCREVVPSPAAQDREAAERLWAESARIASLPDFISPVRPQAPLAS